MVLSLLWIEVTTSRSYRDSGNVVCDSSDNTRLSQDFKESGSTSGSIFDLGKRRKLSELFDSSPQSMNAPSLCTSAGHMGYVLRVL